MTLTEAVSCCLECDLPIPEEGSLEGIECPVTIDLLTEPHPDCSLVEDVCWEHLAPPDDAAEAPDEGEELLPGSRSPREWRGILASMLAHTALFALLVLVPVHSSTGSGNHEGSAVMVHLIQDAPSTPQEESPASIDSAASAASVAERRRDAPDERPKPLQKESTRLDVVEEKNATESGERVAEAEHTEEEKRSKEEKSAVKDKHDVDSPNKSDSVNSVPSVASAPRVMIPAIGSEAADFRANVLSAIEEVAFFPKKALQNRKHGQVVVHFTMHRNGPITGLALIKTSGSEELDRAALRIIERAAEKFPHFPAHFSRESVSYEVPIVFKAATSKWN
jgi:protein TonB